MYRRLLSSPPCESRLELKCSLDSTSIVSLLFLRFFEIEMSAHLGADGGEAMVSALLSPVKPFCEAQGGAAWVSSSLELHLAAPLVFLS